MNHGVFTHNIGVFLLKIDGWCNRGTFCAHREEKGE